LRVNTNLTARSCHDYQGNVTSTALATDGSLKDGIVAKCRPANIVWCAKVAGMITFTELNNNVKLAIHTKFFLLLPIADQNVDNAAGILHALHALDGLSDWLTIDLVFYHTLICKHTKSIEAPFDLLPATFASPNAIVNADSGSRVQKIEVTVLKAACKQRSRM
jgi:hypothetical protein